MATLKQLKEGNYEVISEGVNNKKLEKQLSSSLNKLLQGFWKDNKNMILGEVKKRADKVAKKYGSTAQVKMGAGSYYSDKTPFGEVLTMWWNVEVFFKGDETVPEADIMKAMAPFLKGDHEDETVEVWDDNIEFDTIIETLIPSKKLK